MSAPSGTHNGRDAAVGQAQVQVSSSSKSSLLRPKKMAGTFKSFISKLTPTGSSTDLSRGDGFAKAAQVIGLFPKTSPVVDGEDCLHDCDSCTIKYPAKFSIDEDAHLYGHVDGWATHLLVATGKTDWVRDVADEKGSIMEAVDKLNSSITNGKLKLSASNIPLPEDSADGSTSVLLLPAFTIIDNVTPSTTPDLISTYINTASTNTTPLTRAPLPLTASLVSPPQTPGPVQLTSRPCPHNYLILLCSQKTRDARCGQSAPLLRREFERHLRPLGLYRDLHDERPGGVGIYFISHVGGHKFSANVIIYRRQGAAGTEAPAGPADGGLAEVHDVDQQQDQLDEGAKKETGEEGADRGNSPPNREAAQCIWLARVKPADCENIVRYTVLQGKVVKPETQLRGGFDRCKGLVSW